MLNNNSLQNSTQVDSIEEKNKWEIDTGIEKILQYIDNIINDTNDTEELIDTNLIEIRNILAETYNAIVLPLFGKNWKIILINEYQKCGASWLKKMLGELLI